VLQVGMEAVAVVEVDFVPSQAATWNFALSKPAPEALQRLATAQS